MTRQNQIILKQVQTTREKLIAGQIYHSLPQQLAMIKKQITYQKRRRKIAPMIDSELAIQQLDNLLANINETQTISDDQLNELLALTGHIDPEVRDKRVFSLFNQIMRQEFLTKEQLIWVKDRLISTDYLFSHIDEPQNDAIFLRSFSVMFLAGVLYGNRSNYHVFTDRELVDILNKIIVYTLMEQDHRGYVAQKGWAHTFTHVLNVANELFESKQLTRADKIYLVTAVMQMYHISKASLAYGEDSHLAVVLLNLLDKSQIYTDYSLHLLKQWQNQLMHQQSEESLTFWNRWYNHNRFLHALVVQPDLPQEIENYLKEIAEKL